MDNIAKFFKANPFAGDTGALAPDLAAAFAESLENRTAAVVNHLGRVLLAAFAHSQPVIDDSGKVQEQSSASDPFADDNSLFRGEFLGGKKAVEIFSDLHALQKVYPQARPVPMSSRDIARTALTRGDGLLILNPQSENMQYLGRSAVAALATQTPWTAPSKDSQILSEIRAGIGLINPVYSDCVSEMQITPAEHGRYWLELVIPEDAAEQAQDLVRAIVVTIQETPYLRARLDTLEIRPRLAA